MQVHNFSFLLAPNRTAFTHSPPKIRKCTNEGTLHSRKTVKEYNKSKFKQMAFANIVKSLPYTYFLCILLTPNFSVYSYVLVCQNLLSYISSLTMFALYSFLDNAQEERLGGIYHTYVHEVFLATGKTRKNSVRYSLRKFSRSFPLFMFLSSDTLFLSVSSTCYENAEKALLVLHTYLHNYSLYLA